MKGSPSEPVRLVFLRATLWVGFLLAVLPLVAIARGTLGLLAMPSPASAAGWLRHLPPIVALCCGALFFAYSVKYYLAAGLAFCLAALGRGGNANGHANGNGAEGSNAHPHGLVRIRNGNGGRTDGSDVIPNPKPMVSIHIACYNEQRVIGRLLEACARLEYDAYEVIVVDDSTDGSLEILDPWRTVAGFTIVHRSSRDGFKGGALQEALRHSHPAAVYVLVFDADAVPFPDAIQRFLPHFYEQSADGAVVRRPEIAAVQSYQWHVLNKSENWLTEAVRADYAGSYMAERPLQQVSGGMRMVAGTSYMVRADLLRQVGWGRSLTEDWELTLRLYERGFKVVYTPYAETPAECVSTFPRLVRQRMRWAEGHTHTVRKYFWRILRSPVISFPEKLEFLFFAPYYLQALLFMTGTLAWLSAELVLRSRVPDWTALLGWSLLFSNLLALPLMNLAGLVLEDAPSADYHGVLGALALSMALVPFQAWAALKGLIEPREGPWYRTPKTGRVTGAIHHLRRLKRAQLWLRPPRRRRDDLERPGRVAAVAQRRRPRPLGWILVSSLALALGALGLRAAQAPTVYANPDQLFLRNVTSSVNAADQTLDVEGSLLATKVFNNGTTFTWLSATSYSSGSVAAGTYTFKLDWIANTCGLASSACTITVSWGYCNGGCSVLQPAAAIFTVTLNNVSGQLGSTSAAATGSAITLGGCPCNFYLSISSASGAANAWTLGYDGAVATLCSVNQCDDTNISTPALPVPERLLALAPLSVLLPGLVAAGRRRRGQR